MDMEDHPESQQRPESRLLTLSGQQLSRGDAWAHARSDDARSDHARSDQARSDTDHARLDDARSDDAGGGAGVRRFPPAFLRTSAYDVLVRRCRTDHAKTDTTPCMMTGVTLHGVVSPETAAAEQGGNTLHGSQDFRIENGSSQGQKLALTGLIVPSSLDDARIETNDVPVPRVDLLWDQVFPRVWRAPGRSDHVAGRVDSVS